MSPVQEIRWGRAPVRGLDSTPGRRLRIILAALGLGLGAILGVAGCGVGQVTQTDSMQPAVNGTLGQVGPIAIRDARIAFPEGGAYPSGGEAPLVLTIVNTAPTDDELIDVSSPVAEDVEITSDTSLPGRRALAVGTPDEEAAPHASSSVATTTGTPSSPPPTSGSVPPSSASSVAPTSSTSVTPTTSATEPVQIGKATIVLKGLTSVLNTGRTYPVTFRFRNAGSITLDLPIAAPTSARPEPTGGGATPHG